MFYKGTGMGSLAYSSLMLSPSLNNLQTPFSFKGAAAQMEKNTQPGFKSTKSNQEEKRNSLMITKLKKKQKWKSACFFF